MIKLGDKKRKEKKNLLMSLFFIFPSFYDHNNPLDIKKKKRMKPTPTENQEEEPWQEM